MKRPEEDSEEPLKVVDPQHADWLVKHRAATQHTSAKLYRLLREHPDRLEDFSAAIQLLVSISFSLWRSAFLSDKTGYMEDTNNSAVKFMSEMLENNAIAYPRRGRFLFRNPLRSEVRAAAHDHTTRGCRPSWPGPRGKTET